MSKKCDKCKEVKELTDFWKRKRTKDGRQSACIICQKVYNKEYSKVNSEKLRLRSAKWHKNNPEKAAAKSRLWVELNPEKAAAYNKAWGRANPDKIRLKNARRYIAKKQRTPAWSDLEAIEAIYAKARHLTKVTGVPHEVDHYYPLQGKLVSGLHVETNIQVVTRHANSVKGNSLQP